jgi:hypothetical protein
MNLQAEDDEVNVELLLVEHEPQVFKIDRFNSFSTIEDISQDFKCDICHN